MPTDAKLRVLLVTATELPIPPTSWGGAENVLWQQKLYLESQGHTVKILNAPYKKTVAGIKARPWQYDVIHVHHDRISRHWGKLGRWFRLRVALTSHYGYAAFPEMWAPHGVGFEKIFQEMLTVPIQITLSPEIQETMVRLGYRGRTFVLPNAIHPEVIRFDPGPAPEQALVLGRVEERKKQQFLARVLQGKPVRCDLIGPTLHPEWNGNGENVNYLGPWTRQQVEQDLTRYAAMVLISDGEAHAGVLLEAMAAGLSLVVSPETAHNLDTSQPWVYIVDRNDEAGVADAIQRAVTENPSHRAAIRRHCEETFDWRVIGPRYENILREIAAQPR